MCQVSGMRVSGMAGETNKKSNWAKDQNPHGSLETELVGEETNQEGKEFCQRRGDRANRHDAGALTRAGLSITVPAEWDTSRC